METRLGTSVNTIPGSEPPVMAWSDSDGLPPK